MAFSWRNLRIAAKQQVNGRNGSLQANCWPLAVVPLNPESSARLDLTLSDLCCSIAHYPAEGSPFRQKMMIRYRQRHSPPLWLIGPLLPKLMELGRAKKGKALGLVP